MLWLLSSDLDQHYTARHLNMSGSDPRHKELVVEAAGIVKASNNKVGVAAAMRLVGFTDQEVKQIKLYQQVRRRVTRISVVDVSVDGSPPTSVNVNTVDSQVSPLTGSAATNSPDVTTTESVVTDGNNNNNNKEEDKKPAAKIHRLTSKEKQRQDAKSAMIKRINSAAMKEATTLIQISNNLPKNHPNKKTITEVVKQVNARKGSNISEKTAGRYVRLGMINVSPMKKGPVGDIPRRIYSALKGAYTTFLKLEQAESKKQSSIKKMSKLVNTCVNKAGLEKTRDDLTRKLKRDTADEFEVGKANVIEARRIQWTTAYNLRIWFDTWKSTLLELGFGREPNAGEESDPGSYLEH